VPAVIYNIDRAYNLYLIYKYIACMGDSGKCRFYLHFGTVEKVYTLCECLLYHNSVENFVTKCKQECNVHYKEHKTRDTKIN